MDKEYIENWALAQNLDVREMQPSHLRLIDCFGKYVLDVYIKHKKGRIVANTTFRHADKKWGVANNHTDLLNLVKHRYPQS